MNLKEIVYVGWDRNVICVDKDAPIGEISKKLIGILIAQMVLMDKNFISEQDTDIVILNDYLDYFNDLQGMLPLKRTNLCALIKPKLIEENGIKPEYVLLGAY